MATTRSTKSQSRSSSMACPPGRMERSGRAESSKTRPESDRGSRRSSSASKSGRGGSSRSAGASRSKSSGSKSASSRRSSSGTRSQGGRGGSAQMTTDHEFIRRWAEGRRAKPTCVRGTGGGGDTGVLRLDFPGYSGRGKLQPISWDEWFEKFDDQNLALLYQEKTKDGKKSNFNKLVSREQ